MPRRAGRSCNHGELGITQRLAWRNVAAAIQDALLNRRDAAIIDGNFGPADGNQAFFHGLSHNFQNGSFEFRQFIQK